MASSEVLDFDRLLAPISDEHPAGVALRDHASTATLFFQVKEARQAARNAERKRLQRSMMTEEEKSLDPEGEPVVDWDAVDDVAGRIIAEHSKDLWVGAWWVEALTRLHGFAGLRDGFRLIRELCERYWDEIHPRPDEDGYVTTVAQLTGLNGEDSDGALIRPIENIPLTIDPALSSIDYRDAIDLSTESDPDRRGERLESGVVSLEEFERAVNATSTEFYVELLEDIAATREEFSQLEKVLDERCGQSEDGFSAAPPTSNIRDSLEAVEDRVRSLTRHLFHADEPVASGEGGEMVAVGVGAQQGVSGAVTNREDAFRILLKVAEFFHATEPHSPVSYALEQAVRWGRMSLPELMQDLVSDDHARNEMFRRAGIPIRSDDD